MNLSNAIGAGLILGALHGAAQAAPVAPTFTTGTVTSRTESTTTVTESIRQTEFMTGSSYTVTGTNVSWDGAPAIGANYGIVVPGEAFQFTQTYQGPGISNQTIIQRVTEVTSVTDTTSIFSQ